MIWDQLGLWTTTLLGIALIVRLTLLRIQFVYRVFCIYVAYQITASIVAGLILNSPTLSPFYPNVYVFLLGIGWIVTLWLVYALMAAVLQSLQGILKFSRWMLILTFIIALIVGFISSGVEISDKQIVQNGLKLARATSLAITVERVISTVALLVLLSIISFVLWFPVEMPSNLVRFSFGFLIYFTLKNIVFISHVFWPGPDWYISGALDMALTSICYAVWIASITAEGERVPVRVGHTWQKSERERLLHELNAINKALLTGAKR